MALPVAWPPRTYFYPVGNTPPVCLTHGLSPEKSAEILLLGCGDPRSILYTVHADLAHGNRLLDFTCCDMEPAVLSRNILLLTMICDGVSTDAAWSIFYHFFLDETSHNTLIAQCRTLIQSSSDTKTWKDSKYGKFIRFCTKHSLVETRRHWVLYAESEDLSESQQKAWKASFHADMQTTSANRGVMLTALRACGPFFSSVFAEGPKSYTTFWTTGITKSTSSTIATPYVNPTFAYSLAGKRFNVHYGTDPIITFHLAPALASGITGKSPASITVKDMVDCAKSQFSSWYLSFKARLSSAANGNIVIRFFVGEALSFCQALRICKEQKTTDTGIYSHPWGGAPIVLDSDEYGVSTTPAPLLFNVIETSNLADSSGLINVLIATIPLMDRKPWSTLLTTTLSRSGHGPAQSRLGEAACADIPTLSMFLGVAPSPHLWHFTTHSNKHEIIANSTFDSDQLQETVYWRFVSPFVPNAPFNPRDVEHISFNFFCNEERLANFFFGIYRSMFASKSHIQNANMYVRSSFVALLSLVRGRVGADWARTMEHMLHLILSDHTGSAVASDNYQDVICHMYMRNVHIIGRLTPGYINSVRTVEDRFHGWKNIPPIVCIVLEVPREHLQHFEAIITNNKFAPILLCETSTSTTRNVHSSIHLTFGDIQASVVDGESLITLTEDLRGWSGDSSLIVSFYLPSWILCNAPTSTRVGLYMRRTPLAMLSRPGVNFDIFSSPLTDTAHVHVLRHRPNNVHEIEHLRYSLAPTTKSFDNVRDAILQFSASGEKVTHVIIRKDIADPPAIRSLSSGSKVSVTSKADCVVDAALGSHVLRVIFPFPIRMKSLNTRIARKSSYIEIEAPVRPDFSDPRDLSLNPFAVAHDNEQVNLLNVHYLNLDILPALSLPSTERDLEQISTNAAMMFSVAERESREALRPEDQGPLSNLKETIACILMKSVDMQLARSRFLGLSDSSEDGIYFLMFINEVKLDLASHTLVIDACVIPLVQSTKSKLIRALRDIANHGVSTITTLADQTLAWKHLMPVLAERCRTWKHTDTCEYRTRGIPASFEKSKHSALCGCGKGKNLGRFKSAPEWKLLHGEATRVAISPLFTFSFMDDMPKIPSEIKRDRSRVSLPPVSRGCAKCGGPGKPSLSACSACKMAQYCSRECQKAHWKVHKKECNTPG